MKCSIFIFTISILILYASAIVRLPGFIQVQSPPRIIKQPPTDELLFQVAQTSLHENDKPFVIECEADGEPGPNYHWIKNGKKFEWSVADDRISQQRGRGTLVITHPRQEDLGQYQCFAENPFGIATSNSVFVRMAELNSFKDEPTTSLEANEGEPYKLACQPPDGYPKPRVFWMIQEPNLALKSINNSRITIDPEGNLWFSNVTKEDASKDFYYVCMATSDYRNEYKTGNKFLLKVNSAGSSAGRNKYAPVKQYVTRREEVGFRGKRVELFCIVGGTPLPETIWSKDGKEILASDRIIFDRYGKSLVIKHVISSDEGHYTCKASNGVGTVVTHSIHLSVLAVPYFTVEPEIQNAAEDDTVTFNCKAEGIPEPEIKWIYNGKPISEAPPNPRRTITKNSITIEKLTAKDTGNYGCNATNSIGYVYKDVYVNVLALPPEITEGPENLATVDGKDITIKCTVFGAPKPLVKWIRNGLVLTGGRYKTLDSGDLRINDVGFMDAGTYTCHASNKFGQDERTATLTVKEHTRITDKPEDYEVAAGSTATFRCNAVTDSSLTLMIDWLSNNSTIDFDVEPRFVLASDSSLSITKTIELDSGIYTCVAHTELDEARSQATLIVQDVPNPPELTDTSCRADEAEVRWTSTGDNRAPILRYAIQYNTSFTPDSWETVSSNIPATDHTYIVSLSPWANYTFRVIAFNKIGPSTPSNHGPICTTQPDIPYKNPTNVMGNGTNPQNLVISWTIMPQIEHNGPKFAYKIFFRQDAPGFNWNYRVVNDWRVNRLEENNQPTYKRYQIKVLAINEKGESKVNPEIVIGYSGEDQPSSAPGEFTLLEVKSSTTATLSWLPLHPDHVKGELKGYKIQTWTEDDGPEGMREITVKDPNATRITIEKFIPNSVNNVRILAYNGRYNGPPSELLSFRTPEGVPGTVLSLDAYPLGSSAFQLKWTRPLEPNGNLTGYRIYYQEINGPLLERNPPVNNSDATTAKLPALKSETKYRIHIRATTKAGQGVNFYIEETTRPSRKPDKPQFTWEPINAENSYANIKITWLPNYSGYPGSHFFAKYKLKGSTIYSETKEEFLSDELIIRALLSGEVYVVSIVAVDGDYMTESDPQEIETSSEGPIIQPKENVATAGWFIGMMLAIAILLLILILVCIIKRNRGGKYAVHERELAAGRGDYPDEGGFHEYSQPLDTKSTGGRTSLASSSHHDGKHPESDTDSMAEYGEGDTEGMNEDGSFIGQYGRQRKPEPNSQAFATLV